MVDGLTAHVEYYDRPRRTIDKVADSHDELITWVNRMARQSGQGERALTQATPMVGFRMPDGSRVTASLLTSRPRSSSASTASASTASASSCSGSRSTRCWSGSSRRVSRRG